jgi:hypothetical protein
MREFLRTLKDSLWFILVYLAVMIGFLFFNFFLNPPNPG